MRALSSDRRPATATATATAIRVHHSSVALDRWSAETTKRERLIWVGTKIKYLTESI